MGPPPQIPHSRAWEKVGALQGVTTELGDIWVCPLPPAGDTWLSSKAPVEVGGEGSFREMLPVGFQLRQGRLGFVFAVGSGEKRSLFPSLWRYWAGIPREFGLEFPEKLGPGYLGVSWIHLGQQEVPLSTAGVAVIHKIPSHHSSGSPQASWLGWKPLPVFWDLQHKGHRCGTTGPPQFPHLQHHRPPPTPVWDTQPRATPQSSRGTYRTHGG